MNCLSRIVSLLVLILALGLSACASSQPPVPAEEPQAAQPATEEAPAELIPITFGSIEAASQGYIPLLMQEKGIGQKYGFDVKIFPLTQVGQQWAGLRTGDFDISAGSFLDLMRQREAGLGVTAIRGFINYGNPVMAAKGKSYEKLSDLKGANVGTPSTAVLDWMIIRAAGKKAEGFDIEVDAQPQTTSPPLITEMLQKGELDAAWQFASLSLNPIAKGDVKVITDVSKLLEEAGLDPGTFYLTYNLADAWREKHPDAVPRLVAAMNEAVELMMTDDSVWPRLAEYSGVKDPELVPVFIKQERKEFDTAFSEEKLTSAQALLDELVATVGEEQIGVKTLDPAAFDFVSFKAAAELQK